MILARCYFYHVAAVEYLADFLHDAEFKERDIRFNPQNGWFSLTFSQQVILLGKSRLWLSLFHTRVAPWCRCTLRLGHVLDYRVVQGTLAQPQQHSISRFAFDATTNSFTLPTHEGVMMRIVAARICGRIEITDEEMGEQRGR